MDTAESSVLLLGDFGLPLIVHHERATEANRTPDTGHRTLNSDSSSESRKPMAREAVQAQCPSMDSPSTTGSLTQKWLRQQAHPYPDRDRVYADIDAALTRFTTLRPKSDVYS